jgi:hypothetical protein
MNERIKQLMGQTLDEKFAGTWSVMDLQDLTKFADRFSELIVEECLSVIEEMNPHDPKRDIDDIFDEVDKHFGVEK